ncbi:MAG TPA: penicillin-binding transpeptidase domain-containing protein, partial [Bacillota bacterium]|nr:penicillin-binding transpeptidase domain-containing protein [Bacillota bacterium]
MPPKKSIRPRLFWMLFIYSMILAGLVGRLGFIQFVRGAELGRLSLGQWAKEVPAEPKRGIIYDRLGRELAITTEADTVVAIPAQILDPDATAAQLAAVLGMPRETVRERITRERSLVYVARAVTPAEAKGVRDLALPGISFMVENRRYYPHAHLASQLLGFVGVDGHGLAGVEYTLEGKLAGTPAEVILPVDEAGEPLPDSKPSYTPPVDGLSVYLTIDEVIQHIVERELRTVMEQHDPTSVLAVAIDPRNGQILAMAGLPDFDPNSFNIYPDALWRNASISSSFEPGSTFKIVTAAAALNENVISEEDEYTCVGYIEVAGRRLHCHVLGGHGTLSFTEAVYKSCNPGFVEIGQALGAQTLFSYIDAFGFGKRTGIELPGEASGIMFDRIGPVELATTSFGQGPAVTPLQQVLAVSAVANGGVLYEPSIVKEIRDAAGNLVEQREPVVSGYPITEDTSQRMNIILAGVVAEGGGRNAYLEEYNVAGKTGTAQVPKPGGGYYDDRYVASFIGYAPAEDPRITLMVMVNDPKGPYGYYGSQVAAPAFRAMMLDILSYLEIKPNSNVAGFELPTSVMVPNLNSLSLGSAVSHMRDLGLNLVSSGLGDRIMTQTPAVGSYVLPGSTVNVTLGELPRQDGLVEVPDVSGLSMREASTKLSAVGLSVIIEGSGLATTQSPSAGATVAPGTAV